MHSHCFFSKVRYCVATLVGLKKRKKGAKQSVPLGLSVIASAWTGRLRRPRPRSSCPFRILASNARFDQSLDFFI
jgi:hypothetical protein